MRFLTTIICVLLSFAGISQEKKVIDHTVYNDWKTLKSASISGDGKYISYEITPHRGDGVLCIYNTESGKTDTIERAYGAEFSGGSSYIAFKITPGFDTLRTLELDKVKKSKWPQDSLGIYLLEKDTLMKFAELGSFSMNEENDWMAVSFKHNNLTNPPAVKKKGFFLCRKKKEEPEISSDGKLLLMYHPEHEDIEFANVLSSEMSEKGKYVAFVVHREIEEQDSVHINLFNTVSQEAWVHDTRYTDIQKLGFNHDEDQVVYLASSDTSKVKQYDVYIRGVQGSEIAKIAYDQIGSDTTEAISKNFTPAFTANDAILYFGVGEREYEEPKDTLLDDEKVKLDLWHYEDDRLQPQQLKELRRDQNKSNMYAYHLSDGNLVQISSDTLDVWRTTYLKGDYLLGSSNERYAHTFNWVSPWPEDFYRININTGASELLLEESLFTPSLSPSGQYMAYFKDGNYHFRSFDSNNDRCITCQTEEVTWTSDMNGMPMEAYPVGSPKWNRDESMVYLQSEFDIWVYDVTQDLLEPFSHEIGRSDSIELRPVEWERDSVYFEMENLYFEGFDRKTKGTHFYSPRTHEDHVDLVQTAYFDASVYGIDRSKNKERSILRKMTFQDYPEVYTYTDNMQSLTKISETNPQQEEFKWGTVELTKWTAYDGTELEGLLYKPEDFDTSKSYPLMVYFYEMYSDRLHQHYIPKPTASIVYATEYVSAGYVFFIPDIRYEPGHPAKSAYNCIMSGTDHILEILPNVDSNRMALQGQSWGGYQTAQLVTMTDRYAAAMAGAPVANMFSAYGGIRWGSGLNRQFQYERTQSRIGYTIWERPDLYVENSPLFHLPNVTTPLLIMHNDQDGAVPWYQGIELFTGLKRLGKTAWLLNYNDDDHNLMRNANRFDLSIRMRQFFDYYLLDEPAPRWLTDGIPATVKGKEMRYELNEETE